MVENSRINDVIVKASGYATDPSKVCTLLFSCISCRWVSRLCVWFLFFIPTHTHTHTHTRTHTHTHTPPSGKRGKRKGQGCRTRPHSGVFFLFSILFQLSLSLSLCPPAPLPLSFSLSLSPFLPAPGSRLLSEPETLDRLWEVNNPSVRRTNSTSGSGQAKPQCPEV